MPALMSQPIRTDTDSLHFSNKYKCTKNELYSIYLIILYWSILIDNIWSCTSDHDITKYFNNKVIETEVGIEFFVTVSVCQLYLLSIYLKTNSDYVLYNYFFCPILLPLFLSMKWDRRKNVFFFSWLSQKLAFRKKIL